MAAPETLFAPLGTLAERLAGARVLVLASSQRHVAAVRAALPGIGLTVFDGARVHVPIETVEAATAVLAASSADTLVAIGGGSAIGLGKALRLSHAVRFIAVPTTYAGSEMTRMYGITRGTDKQTGRDDKVRPDLVLYDVALTVTMPLALGVQSLMNAIAHVASTLSTRSIPESDAFAAVRAAIEAIEGVVGAPADLAAREAALRAASACAALFDRGAPGAQHALAHLLGGATGLDHAALHSVILPHFLARLDPALLAELESVAGPELAARLRDLLAVAGAPTTLAELGVTREALDRALAARPELLPLALAAY
ncbi:MAG: iron-containing alcohol dehydrogenase [Myxococcales bacterium]|nr:iron-containing alcohol dehydrogenase [Myxococcales bacterium]